MNSRGAQAQYRAVLELEPDNINALNNLAWYLRLENPAKALDFARRASKIAPELPAVLDTLAVVEHLNGDNESARANIQRARAGAPEDLSMRYHEAMIEAALGETGKAIATLEELVAKDAGERKQPAVPEQPDRAGHRAGIGLCRFELAQIHRGLPDEAAHVQIGTVETVSAHHEKQAGAEEQWGGNQRERGDPMRLAQ